MTVLGAFVLSAGAADAQQISARAADITLGGRLHTQYLSSSVGASDDDFFLRRARLTADVVVNERVDGRLMTDVSGGSADVQDAYLRFRFSTAFRVSVGQMKRAFDPFELESSTQLPLVERDGRVPGVDACSGVGGTCSYSRLVQKLKYSERDVGVRVDGSIGERAAYQVTVTNGEGINTRDVNDSKSLSARVEVEASAGVTVGANFGLHDYPTGNGSESDYGGALGADFTVGSYYGGPMLMASLVRGDNWRAPDASGEPTAFTTAQIVGSYYFTTPTTDLIEGVEPVLRVSAADPNGDADDDGGVLVTPGLHAYFSGRNRVGVNLDVFNPSSGDAEWSFKVMTYLYF